MYACGGPPSGWLRNGEVLAPVAERPQKERPTASHEAARRAATQAENETIGPVNPQPTGLGDAAGARMISVVFVIFALPSGRGAGPTFAVSIHARAEPVKHYLHYDVKQRLTSSS